MREAIYLDPNMVPSHLRGRYSGKKFKAVVTDRVTIRSHDGLWSGGSRDTYSVVELSTGRTIPASDNMSAPWDSCRKDRVVELKPGIAVVEHTIFCGKDMGLTFYVHADNAAALLPAPAAELNAHEKLVLKATAEYKSSYNGRDRYQMMLADDRSADFPTREQWDHAKQSLIAAGYLNKAGAITNKGRNAR